MRPLLARLPPLSRAALRLDQQRRGEIDALLQRQAATVAKIRDAVTLLAHDPDPAAAQVVDELTDRLLAEHRCWDGGGALTRLDSLLHSDGEEILDRPDVDAGAREHAMKLLHLVNQRLGSYRMWEAAVDECIAGLDAPHVYDLAAGTGGFARHLAQAGSLRSRRTFTSSDLDTGYIAEGARRAREEGLDIRFDVHDALLLSDLEGVDLFVCTQAAHHFTAGAVVRMIAQAVQTAPRGILIIDLLRGAAAMAGTVALLALVMPHHIIVRDGLQSVRRAWLPSELELLARIAGAANIDARAFGPAHCSMHALGVKRSGGVPNA